MSSMAASPLKVECGLDPTASCVMLSAVLSEMQALVGVKMERERCKSTEYQCHRTLCLYSKTIFQGWSVTEYLNLDMALLAPVAEDARVQVVQNAINMHVHFK